jgi:hypothetical protein
MDCGVWRSGDGGVQNIIDPLVRVSSDRKGHVGVPERRDVKDQQAS